jgi:tetratricopeptide (TPR) repeat protein
MKNILTVAICFFIISTVSAAGTRSNFLSHGPSVSAFGRGETSAGIRDVSISFYNPAGLLRINNSASFSAFKLFDGAMYNYAGFSRARGSSGAFALSAINLRATDIEARQDIDDAPRSAYANQWAFLVSLARRLPWFRGGIDAGINLKYVCMDLYGNSGGDIGLDAGLSKNFTGPDIFSKESRITAGAAVQNLAGPRIRLISEDDVYAPVYLLQAAISVPVSLVRDGKGGLGYFDELSLMADGVFAEGEASGRFGAEYRAMDRYALRAGCYKEHLTAGAGYRIGSVSMDYAADLSQFAVFHRLGISLRLPGRGADVSGRKELLEEALMKADEERIRNKELDDALGPELRDARRKYREGLCLKATDELMGLLAGCPEYGPARELYGEIVSKMYGKARGPAGSDFEELCYAKGFVAYSEQNLTGAMNEWEKVLQADPNRKEVSEYLAKARSRVEDMDRLAKEQETELKAAGLFDEAEKYYSARKWVQCVKRLEKLKSLCEKERFANSFLWREKAEARIESAVKELSGDLRRDKNPSDDRDGEVDARSAEKKYNEGLILYAQGKLSGAARMWEIALRFNPAHEKAKQAFDKVRLELDQAQTPGKQLN